MSSVAGVGAGAAADVSRRGRTGPSSSRRGDLLRSAASSAESSSSFLSRRGGAASSGGSSAALGPVVVGAGVAGVVVRSLFVDVVGASCACGNAGALVEVVGTDVVCVSPVVVGATGVGSGIVGGVVESSSVWVPSRSRSRSPSSFSRCLFRCRRRRRCRRHAATWLRKKPAATAVVVAVASHRRVCRCHVERLWRRRLRRRRSRACCWGRRR